MRQPLYAGAVIAVLAVAGVATFYAFGPGANLGSRPTPSPTLQQTQAPSPTATASPIDTTRWETYESDRYGFIIGHPSDWTVEPANHDWTLTADADNWLSTGQEVFRPPSGDIRVSAWSVPVDRGTTPETRADVEAWVEAYCQASGNPCTGIRDRGVPLCVERRDCHPGLLVPFTSDVQAFFEGGIYPDSMVVVVVWWGETEPAVAPYGGSRRLLEAFLSTMAVWPESVPFGERECFVAVADRLC